MDCKLLWFRRFIKYIIYYLWVTHSKILSKYSYSDSYWSSINELLPLNKLYISYFESKKNRMRIFFKKHDNIYGFLEHMHSKISIFDQNSQIQLNLASGFNFVRFGHFEHNSIFLNESERVTIRMRNHKCCHVFWKENSHKSHTKAIYWLESTTVLAY